MATAEELNLSYQVFTDLTNLRRDLWNITNSYTAKLQTSQDQPTVTALIVAAQAVAAGAMLRINRISALIAVPAQLTALTNGLTGMNCTIASANAMFTTAKNATIAFQTSVQAAAVSTDLQSAVNAFQAAVPQPISMW